MQGVHMNNSKAFSFNIFTFLGLGGNRVAHKLQGSKGMPKLTLLQIDDEDFVHEMFVRRLSKINIERFKNYEITHVKTLEEAYGKLSARHFDLIISDRSLGNGVDAFENVSNIRKLAKNSKILGMSFYADKKQVEGFLSSGGDVYISKTDLKEELEITLKGLF